VQLFNLVVVDREANASLIFDVAELPDPGYGDTSWRTVVAAHVPYELPALVAAPRRVRSVDLPGDLEIAPTDLATVNERWLVRTEDRAFAAAFLDQRMLAWIDTLDGDLCLEAGGPWLLVSAGTMVGPEGWGPLLGALDAYRGRVPRVVTSLYPGTTAASFPS
jgi:hypothetical protein